MEPLVLRIDSDNTLTLTGLALEGTSTWINNATVTFTLLDSTGAAVTGASNLPMSYVAASNGNYQCTLPYTVSLKKDTIYKAQVPIRSSQGNLTINRAAIVEYAEG